MTRSRTFAALAASAVTVLAAGCGAASKKEAAPAAGGTKVGIVDFKFKPASITVPKGTKLVFANNDTAAHTATADDRSFDTGSIRKGKQATVTLGKAGTFAYVCQFHPFMKGAVVVK